MLPTSPSPPLDNLCRHYHPFQSSDREHPQATSQLQLWSEQPDAGEVGCEEAGCDLEKVGEDYPEGS